MTIGELIQELQKYPPETKVYCATQLGLCDAGVVQPRNSDDEVHILGNIYSPRRRVTKKGPVTDEEIKALRTEAAEAGDIVQAAICDRALGVEIAEQGHIRTWLWAKYQEGLRRYPTQELAHAACVRECRRFEGE